MRKRRRVTGAATAALPLEGLPDVPCTHDGGRAVLAGVVFVRRCELPDGHVQRDVPHRWSRWIETGETIVDDDAIELDF